MVEQEREHRKKISASDNKHDHDFSSVLNDYASLIFDEADKSKDATPSSKVRLPLDTCNMTSPPFIAQPRQSFEHYLQNGPADDSHLDNRNYSLLTRAGGRSIKLKKGGKNKMRRLSIDAVQKQMKDVTGMLQKGFNQLVQGGGGNSTLNDPHNRKQKKSANLLDMARFLFHFVYHVLVGGFFDGINSMIQIWAILVLISGLIRAIQVADAEAINTAIISLASIAFFLSFMLFYRVNATFGPFIVILKEMTVKDLSKVLPRTQACATQRHTPPVALPCRAVPLRVWSGHVHHPR